MYYVKIPLRHLCEPWELKVPDDRREQVWQRRVSGLLQDLSEGIIPHWAIDMADLRTLVLLREDDGPPREATTKATGE